MCHSERREESLHFAQDKLREESGAARVATTVLYLSWAFLPQRGVAFFFKAAASSTSFKSRTVTEQLHPSRFATFDIERKRWWRCSLNFGSGLL